MNLHHTHAQLLHSLECISTDSSDASLCVSATTILTLVLYIKGKSYQPANAAACAYVPGTDNVNGEVNISIQPAS